MDLSGYQTSGQFRYLVMTKQWLMPDGTVNRKYRITRTLLAAHAAGRLMHLMSPYDEQEYRTHHSDALED